MQDCVDDAPPGVAAALPTPPVLPWAVFRAPAEAAAAAEEVCGAPAPPPVRVPPTAVTALLARAAAHPAAPLRIAIALGQPVARVYATPPAHGRPTTGGTASSFGALTGVESFVRGLLPRVYHSIQHAYVLDALRATDIVVTAESGGVARDPIVAALTACHEGREPLAAATSAGGLDTAVQGFALLRLMLVRAPDSAASSNWNLRRFTAANMTEALGKLWAGHEATLAGTEGMPMYAPGAPGAARLAAYRVAHGARKALLQQWRAALADAASATCAALPPAEVTRTQGRNSNVLAAAPTFQSGDRVLYLSAISGAGGTRGCGSVMLRRITALADSLGAYVVIRAVPIDGLCYTFYSDAGFQFVRHKTTMPGPGADDYDCPLMLRAPDAARVAAARTVPLPPERAWGLDASRRFQPGVGTATVVGPFRTHVAAWDACDEYQVRGQHLMALDGVLEAYSAPRAMTFRGLPAWGAPTVGDAVTDADARALVAHMGALAPVPPVAQLGVVRAREEEAADISGAEEPEVKRPRPAAAAAPAALAAASLDCLRAQLAVRVLREGGASERVTDAALRVVADWVEAQGAEEVSLLASGGVWEACVWALTAHGGNRDVVRDAVFLLSQCASRLLGEAEQRLLLTAALQHPHADTQLRVFRLCGTPLH